MANEQRSRLGMPAGIGPEAKDGCAFLPGHSVLVQRHNNNRLKIGPSAPMQSSLMFIIYACPWFIVSTGLVQRTPLEQLTIGYNSQAILHASHWFNIVLTFRKGSTRPKR